MRAAGLQVTTVGQVLRICLDRPDRGNALDAPTTVALIDRIRRVDEDRGDVRAVVLTANGKHFCTGAEIGGGGGDGGGRPSIGHMVRSLAHGPHELIEVVWGCRLPTVALVRGRASGLGLHLALACDFVLADEGATFAEPFAQRGFNVDSGGSWLLPRLVGVHRAKQLLYLGDALDAPTASAWGLIGEVVAPDELEPAGMALAERLAAGPTFSLGVTKGLVQEHLGRSLPEALLAEAAAVELTIRSRDFKEGMTAFLEKRPPTFSGD